MTSTASEAILTTNPQRVGLILYWTLVTAIGGMAAVLVLPLVFAEAFRQVLQGGSPTAALLAAPLAGALGGGLSGLLQWLMLRRFVAGLHGWLLSSLLGWAAGLTAGVGIFFWLAPERLGLFSLLLPAAAAGVIAAAIQWRVLRPIVTGAAWWIAAGATGWMLGLIVSLGLSSSNSPLLTTSPGLFILIPGGIFGAVLGFQTGFALVVLMSYAAAPGPAPVEPHMPPSRSPD